MHVVLWVTYLNSYVQYLPFFPGLKPICVYHMYICTRMCFGLIPISIYTPSVAYGMREIGQGSHMAGMNLIRLGLHVEVKPAHVAHAEHMDE